MHGSAQDLCTARRCRGPRIRSLSAKFSKALDYAVLVRNSQAIEFTLFSDRPTSVLFALRVAQREPLAANRIIDFARDFHFPDTALGFSYQTDFCTCPDKVGS
jgi:hypothetical protein